MEPTRRVVLLLLAACSTLLLLQVASTVAASDVTDAACQSAQVTPGQSAILLTTDRPIYRPGQTMHIRALVAEAFARDPLAGQLVRVTIFNPQGVKVFQQEASTSKAGIGAWEFVISPLVGGGPYRITAAVGSTTSAITVQVDARETPRFLVEPTFDRSFYLPGDSVSGYIRAYYPYGQPVQNARVELRGWAYDGKRSQVFARTSWTDESGFLHFIFALPRAYTAEFSGPSGADFVLEIEVVDQMGHSVRVSHILPVGAQPIHIRAVPESGTLEPDLRNVIYLLCAYPDAEPAPCQLQVEVEGKTYELVAGPTGVAELSLTPSGKEVALHITAKDQEGRTGHATITLPVAEGQNTLLLRPERPLYRVGETLHAAAVSPEGRGRIRLTLSRQGRQFGSHVGKVEGITATFSVPLSPDMGGLLRLRTDRELSGGATVSDMRTVLVRPNKELDLQITLDQPVYRPGDHVRVTLEARDEAGLPVSATVGIGVVDQSVFAKQEPDLDMAQWFLTMSEDMLTPSREPCHPFIPSLLEPVPPDAVEARDTALSAALADWTEHSPPLTSVVTGSETGETATVPGDPQESETEAPPTVPAVGRLLTVTAILLLLSTAGVLAALWRYGRLEGPARVVGGGVLALAAVVSCVLLLRAQQLSSSGGRTAPGIRQPETESPTVSSGRLETWPTEANPKRSHDPVASPVFPETMAWYSATKISDSGRLELDLELPDMITPTWQLAALGSTMDGGVGFSSAPIEVYQEVWATVHVPPNARYGETIAVSVDTYNYQDDAQEVRVSLPEEDWFQHVEAPTQEIELATGEMDTVHFPIEVMWGGGRFQPEVPVTGKRIKDGFTPRAPIEITPDGQRFDETQSDWLSPGLADLPVLIPSDAISGASQIDVKIYPSTLSQLVVGIDSLLRQPYGCFEQATSVTYPNVTVLQFLKAVGKANAAVSLKANAYLSLGYQLLVSFEVPGGGFSLWGDHPADRMLSAYGLMLLSDMAQVFPVDEDLTQRTADWLLQQQNSDGTWDNDQGLVHETSWSQLGNSHLPVTAYVTWALSKAGYGDDPRTQAGLEYIRAHLGEAEGPYVLALCANALVTADSTDASTRTALDSLAQEAVVEGKIAYWPSDISSFVGSVGPNSNVETTALATQALLRADLHLDLAYRSIIWLVQQKRLSGAWGNTQGTILSLQALQQAAVKGGDSTDATVQVSVNGHSAPPMQFTPANSSVASTVCFSDVVVPMTNSVQIDVDGVGNLTYQLHTSYYKPWPLSAESAPTSTVPLDMVMRYDPARLEVGDETKVTVHIPLREGTIEWGIVKLAIPPGFEVEPGELDQLLSRSQDSPPGFSEPTITRVDRRSDHFILYFEKLEEGHALDFDYHLRAHSPVALKTPPSRVYDYYNPEVEAEAPPVEIEILEK